MRARARRRWRRAHARQRGRRGAAQLRRAHRGGPVVATTRGFVVINGAPGAGKSTLAAALAAELALPVLSKDALKEGLHDALGGEPAQVTRAYGQASYELLRVVMTALARGGGAAVVDANLARGRSEAWLRDIAALAPLLYVHLECDRALIAARCRDRAASRHAVHSDGDDAARVFADLNAGRYDPLELGVPALTVRTGDGYDPPLARISALARDVLVG